MSTNTKHSKKGIMIAHNTQSTDMHTCIVWSKPFNKFWTNKLLVHKAVYVYCKAHYNTHQTLILQHTQTNNAEEKRCETHPIPSAQSQRHTKTKTHNTDTYILQHTKNTYITTHNRYTYYNTQQVHILLHTQQHILQHTKTGSHSSPPVSTYSRSCFIAFTRATM